VVHQLVEKGECGSAIRGSVLDCKSALEMTPEDKNLFLKEDAANGQHVAKKVLLFR